MGYTLLSCSGLPSARASAPSARAITCGRTDSLLDRRGRDLLELILLLVSHHHELTGWSGSDVSGLHHGVAELGGGLGLHDEGLRPIELLLKLLDPPGLLHLLLLLA